MIICTTIWCLPIQLRRKINCETRASASIEVLQLLSVPYKVHESTDGVKFSRSA